MDESIISFTHDAQWNYMLPGIPPTGKRVEIPHVVVMKFENGKVAHEHIYWNQASVLVQVGLLDPVNLAGCRQDTDQRGAEFRPTARLDCCGSPTPSRSAYQFIAPQKNSAVFQLPIETTVKSLRKRAVR